MKSFYFFVLCTIGLSISAQDYLNPKIGGFFEQLYGGETNEEAIDLCPTQSSYLVSGWTDVESEGITKDATIWYNDRIGKNVYTRHYGSILNDEVAVGIADVDDEHFTFCAHVSRNWIQDEVQVDDYLIIYYIETATGNVVWTDTIIFEEEGVAPTDILYDGKNIFVLYNRLNLSGIITNQIVKYDLTGTKIWTSQNYVNALTGRWAAEFLEHNGSFVTIPYSYDFDCPEIIVFNSSGAVTAHNTFSNQEGRRTYGLLRDDISGKFYAAGYEILEENDTNAYVLSVNANYTFSSGHKYGLITGQEKFRDLVLAADGLLCGGVRNNQGEGLYDVYIHHLDGNMLTIMEETFGGSTSERLSSMMLDETLTKSFFAGHNIEYTISGSGNAYLGGITTQLSTPQTCLTPRVLLVDQLVGQGSSGINTWINLANSSGVINTAHTHNANIVLLYDVDRIFAQGSGATSATKDEVYQFVTDLASATPSITVGFIVGPDMDKIAKVANIMKGVIRAGMTLSGKVNYIMLEHEYWNVSADPGNWSVLDPSEYGSGLNANPWLTNPPSGLAIERDQYFWHMAKDHESLLQEIDQELQTNQNWWGAIDYIGFLHHHDNVTTNYFDLSATSYSTLTALANADAFKANAAENFIDEVDFTFLAYYRVSSNNNHFIGGNSTGVPNYDIAASTTGFGSRLKAYSDAKSFAKGGINKFRHLALFSNEQPVCGDELLGGWLNNSANDYNKAEDAFNTQWAASNCSTCIADSDQSGYGWFKFSCIDDHGPFSNYDQVSCAGTVNISIAEQGLMEDRIFEIFPNPTNGMVVLKTDYDFTRPTFLRVYDSHGSLMLEKKLLEKETKVNFEKFPSGFYIVSLTSERLISNQKLLVH